MSASATRTHFDHVAVESQLDELVRLATSPEADAAGLREAVPLFLRRWGRQFDRHFALEEQISRAGVRDGFPADLAGIDDIRRDREVVAAIIELLEVRKGALLRGETEAEADVTAAIKDLTILWQRHVRRREVLGRLLPPAREGDR